MRVRAVYFPLSGVLTLLLILFPQGFFPKLFGELGRSTGLLSDCWKLEGNSPFDACLILRDALLSNRHGVKDKENWNSPLSDRLVQTQADDSSKTRVGSAFGKLGATCPFCACHLGFSELLST